MGERRQPDPSGLLRRLPDGGVPLRRASPAGPVLVLAAVGYSVLGAYTTPFRWPADVVTAVPLGALVAVVVLQSVWNRRHQGPIPARAPAAVSLGSVLPWVLVIAGIAALELVTLFSAPRSAYPTISSIYDTLARWRAVKAAIFFGWLWLGWVLVRE